MFRAPSQLDDRRAAFSLAQKFEGVCGMDFPAARRMAEFMLQFRGNYTDLLSQVLSTSSEVVLRAIVEGVRRDMQNWASMSAPLQTAEEQLDAFVSDIMRDDESLPGSPKISSVDLKREKMYVCVLLFFLILLHLIFFGAFIDVILVLLLLF